MSNLEIKERERIHQNLTAAIDNAIDATPDRAGCEAWYEVIEAVLVSEFDTKENETNEKLGTVWEAIDERWGEVE